MNKDTISVNMNVYDIPIVVEQLKKLEQENKQLKDKIEKLKDYGEKVGERRNQLYEKIDKAIEYMNSLEFLELMNSENKEDYFKAKNKLLEILGDKE